MLFFYKEQHGFLLLGECRADCRFMDVYLFKFVFARFKIYNIGHQHLT